ncbi:MAG: amidophosphoribosyltransferase [Firmicutes bacterium]|nr:amidophosphoribosyltransferase [Bacillota bacterium]
MCGVFGIFGGPGEVNAASLTYMGLYALQHRGQESAGMAVSDGDSLQLHKEMGLTANVFDEEIINRLPGSLAIGHVRYSTTGESSIINAQPLLAHCSKGAVALAHNGNLTNAQELRRELELGGSVFQTTTDSEVVINLIARFGKDDLQTATIRAAKRLRGSYALVILARDKLIGLRDPLGIRPLCLGRLADGAAGRTKAYILASESCALSNLGAEFLREVEPGEMVVIDQAGLRSIKFASRRRQAFCVFEYIYFARPDTFLAGKNVHEVRKAIGAVLAGEAPVEADVVIPAPDSGTSAAMGFAAATGIPFEIGLIKNRYVGRTFIQPAQEARELGVRIKLNPVESVIRGRRVVVIDDSIVRGTTSATMVRLLREAGAREVHLYIASPPYLHPCYYGIDTSQAGELVAATHTPAEIRDLVGADTLHYLSLQGLLRAVGTPGQKLCAACFNGKYPVPVQQEVNLPEASLA